MLLYRRSCNKATACVGLGGGIHHDPKFAVPKICEDGAYHLSKPFIFDYGVAVGLFV